MFDISTQEERLARIAELERGKSAAAAEQARLTAQFDAVRRADEAAAGMAAGKRGRGVGSEIALARRDSPNKGGRHLGFARALVDEMPHTLAALTSGVLSEWRATLIVRESACLTVEHRRELDAEMCADASRLDGCGDARIAADAKAIAYRLDPQAVAARAAKAAEQRTVTCRPAPDCMVYVTALLPVAQGVAVYAACKREAELIFDGRSRHQVMADTLVHRVTGRPADSAVPVAVNVVLSDDTLLGGDDPAVIDDYGPVPAEVARRLIAHAVDDPESRATLRKLYARPDSGTLVAMESTVRKFPKGLAHLIRLRDQRCRTPFCDAPIRHIDHIQARSRGGATSGVNGQGLCEHCNYVKELAHWKTVVGVDDSGRHRTTIETPTGSHHHSLAPPILPGRRRYDYSEIEHRISIALYDKHAA